MINPDLTINTDLAREILTGFVRSEITRVGMSRAIINLSPVDSTRRSPVRLPLRLWAQRMSWRYAFPIALLLLIRWNMLN